MIELRGKYNYAVVYTDNIEQEAVAQIIELCNQEFAEGSAIRIMPDTHAGAGCTIGTTMTIKDKIVPNMVGVDIGCGMETVRLKQKEIDLEKLDKTIYRYVPAGFNIRAKEHPFAGKIDFEGLEAKKYIDKERARLSIGTLGGGNHFIEVDKDAEGNLYLVIHSGSRYLGKQIAQHYQEKAYKALLNVEHLKQEVINTLKAQGREKDIQTELKKLGIHKVNRALAYVQGENFAQYMNDMKIVQQYAALNRKAMILEIVRIMGLEIEEQFTTIHNYIDTENMILRKGAISAQKGETVLIPINMRDGSLICMGKGNAAWNYSAPHGAGRLMSRGKAKATLSLKEYEEAMAGIYTTSVSKATLDEAPMVYKPMEEIMANIHGSVDIVKVLKPIYNFKAGEEGPGVKA